MADKVGGIIRELDPHREGWKMVGDRRWLKPDGTVHTFPPDGPEIVYTFDTYGPDEPLQINRWNRPSI